MGENGRRRGWARAIRAIAALAVLASASGALQTDDEAAVERVRFVFADGTPVRSARVFHWTEGERYARRDVTDDGGGVARGELSESQWLALPGAEFGFVVRPVPGPEDEPVVRLGEGPELVGRVTVNGAAPGRPIVLELDDDPAELGLPEELPVGSERTILREARRITSLPDGRFRRAGVPADWTIGLELPHPLGPHSPYATPDELRVADAPVILDLQGPSAIVGRLMRSRREGASGASCRLYVESIHRQSGHSFDREISSGTALRGGWFSLPVREWGLQPGDGYESRWMLQVSDRASDGTLVHEVWPIPTSEEGESVDLGVLPLTPTPPLRIRPLDRDGRPIDAPAWALVETWNATVEDGELLFRALPDLESVVLVGAVGFQVAALALPVPRDEAVDVWLDPAQRVRLVYGSAADLAGRELNLQLTLALPPEEPGADLPSMTRMFEAVGRAPNAFSYSSSSDEQSARFQLDQALQLEEDAFSMWLSAPVASASAELTDRYGRVLARSAPLPVDADEVELRIPTPAVPPGTLLVQLLDADGEPAGRTRVHVEFDSNTNTFFHDTEDLSTDADGLLRIENLARQPVSLWSARDDRRNNVPALARLVPDDGDEPREVRLP